MRSVRERKVVSRNMSDIASIGQSAHPGRTEFVGRAPASTETELKPPTAPVRHGDSVELSDHARFLDQLNRLPDVRHNRIEELRGQIANGTYETNERLDLAIDHLIDDLAGE